jgi:murein DD-endopeptidase MepM/ murein hydrolase activator NlpD
MSQILVTAVLSSLLFLSAGRVFAADINQQILDLRSQIDALTKQADQYKGNISKTQKQATTLKNQIDILSNQILKLQTQIAITGKQISEAQLQITDLEGQIVNTQQVMDKQKQTVSELMTTIYENDQLSTLAVLLKSPTLSSFSDQEQQNANLNSKLVTLIGDLKSQRDQLQSEKDQLDQKKTQLVSLNSQMSNQENSLGSTRSSKDKLLVATKGQEAKFQSLLSDVETKESQFFNTLKDLEAQAVKSGAYIIHVTATSIPPKGSKIFQWPFDSYYLTQSYGMTTYALRGAYGGAPHNGIDIVSTSGAAIRPIASGYVLASGNNSGWGNWIAIRQDNDLVSLYAHMSSPAGLANNTQVTTSSIVGYEGATGNVTGEHLHLSIYSDFFTYINPKNGQLYFNYFDGTLNPLDYL